MNWWFNWVENEMGLWFRFIILVVDWKFGFEMWNLYLNLSLGMWNFFLEVEFNDVVFCEKILEVRDLLV